jgi:ribonuclease Y
MDALSLVLGIVAGLAIGSIVALYFINKRNEAKADSIVNDATQKAQSILKSKELEAKEKFFELKNQHDEKVNTRNRELADAENRLRGKEQSLTDKINNLEKRQKEAETLKEELAVHLEVAKVKKQEAEKLHASQVQQLEKIAGLSARSCQK